MENDFHYIASYRPYPEYYAIWCKNCSFSGYISRNLHQFLYETENGTNFIECKCSIPFSKELLFQRDLLNGK